MLFLQDSHDKRTRFVWIGSRQRAKWMAKTPGAMSQCSQELALDLAKLEVRLSMGSDGSSARAG